MPISELVIGTLRREVAQAGLSHLLKSTPQIFSTVPGSLSTHIGHVVKHNGKDISSEYKPIFGLEWDRVESFHDFYPASEAFQSFVGAFVPYAAAKGHPQLFEPSSSSSSFHDLLAQGAPRIFIAPAVASKKDEVSAAWSKVLETVGKDGLVGQWSGWGVEGDEGTWAGILSWKGGKELERSSTDASVVEAVQKLKGLAELDEYEVSFTSTSDTA